MRMVALIPARAGSKRIPGKNTRLLAGHPLIAYTIAAAQQSGVFERVDVVTDDYGLVQWMFENSGARAISREPAGDDQADIVWVRDYFRHQPRTEQFAILRPTSPFRTAETIRRAYKAFTSPGNTMDSLRAVEPVSQHPGKMWSVAGPGYPMESLLDRLRVDKTPWHSSPTQSLPSYYIQNACLEMSWTRNVEVFGTISGRKIAPFFTEGYEGTDLNTEDDWRRVERLIAEGQATLPPLAVAPLSPLPAA